MSFIGSIPHTRGRYIEVNTNNWSKEVTIGVYFTKDGKRYLTKEHICIPNNALSTIIEHLELNEPITLGNLKITSPWQGFKFRQMGKSLLVRDEYILKFIELLKKAKEGDR